MLGIIRVAFFLGLFIFFVSCTSKAEEKKQKTETQTESLEAKTDLLNLLSEKEVPKKDCQQHFCKIEIKE